MKTVVRVMEGVIAVGLFADGVNRLVEPVPMAPASVPWLAGLTELAQWLMIALGSLEVVTGAAVLLPVLIALSDLSLTVHSTHHGAHP